MDRADYTSRADRADFRRRPRRCAALLALRLAVAATTLAAAAFVAACGGTAGGREVVVYTSVDQEFAEKALDRFEARSGITVKAVYDVEAAKTTGLVNRLIAEKDARWRTCGGAASSRRPSTWRPRASSRRTCRPRPPTSRPRTRTPAGSGRASAGGRASLIVNTDALKEGERPSSIGDLVDSPVPADRIGLAHPVFGTAATQAAALYAAWGADKAKAFYGDVAKKGVRIVDGNAVVRDLVMGLGRARVGRADTDDGCGLSRRARR
ncbi:MAG: hypothetical protein U0470_00145 [Anaerolineae bacterium]